MGKTLTTILLGLFLGTASSSCTPEGRSLALSLFRQGASDAIAHELNPHETNVNVYNQGQNNQRLPENVIKTETGYMPASGYTWANPNNKNLGVVKIPNWDEYRIRNERVGDWIAPPSFTFLDWKDTNKDTHTGKDELIGLGNYFKFKEGQEKLYVNCGSIWQGVKGKRLMIKLEETKTGNIIGIKELPTFTKDYKLAVKRFYTEKNAREGVVEYSIKWFIDGKHIKTRDTNFFVDYGQKEK